MVARRAVLYARVSSDDREKHSLEDQQRLCYDYAQSKGYVVVAELQEDERGVSGADPDAPELNHAVALAEAGQYDVLVCREMDRLARSLAKQMIVEDRLKRAGVSVEYALARYDDSPEGQLQKLVRASVAEYERLKIHERMQRGKQAALRRGNIMSSGRPPYGYRIVEQDGVRTLEIDEAEAEIVRQIFEWYVRGDEKQAALSTYGIAQKLRRAGVPRAADLGRSVSGSDRPFAHWEHSSVMFILKNQTYAGEWSYDPTDGESIVVEVPAIIDQELFDLAQQQRKINRITAKRNVKHNYLLRGRLTCGGCGYRLIAKMVPALLKSGKERWHYYYECHARGRPHKARTCTARAARATDLDAAVWRVVVSLFSDPEKLRDAYAIAQAEAESGSEPLRQELEALDAEIARLEARRERLLEVYLDGGATTALYRERRDEIEVRLDELHRERGRASAQLAAFDEGAVFDLLDDFAATVYNQVASVQDFDERRWYVDTLDIQGLVGLKNEDGTRQVEIRAHGVHIATILV